MLLTRALLFMALCLPLTFSVGCGGHEAGVVEGPGEPEPELTPEEEAGEEEYIRSSRPE